MADPTAPSPSSPRPRRVLFVCMGNTCRSPMAAALVNHFLGDAWQATSAGIRPGRQVSPLAVEAMKELGIDIQDHQPCSVEAFREQPWDLVILLSDRLGSVAQDWPRVQERLLLPFPDPYDATGDRSQRLAVYRQVRDAMRAQLLPLLAEKATK